MTQLVYNGIYEYVYVEGERLRQLNIYVGEEKLMMRHDLMNHSQKFSVGFFGSGHSQTSLAILSHAMGDEFAMKHYMTFKKDIIATLSCDEDFAITPIEMSTWVQSVTSTEVMNAT